MINLIARRFLINGEVQGVGYRFFALRAAARHQVLGTVRNLPDGRVEVIAEGDRDAMDEFKKELAEQEAVRQGDERNYQRVLDRLQPYKDRVALHERNVDSLKRELGNLR